MIPNITQNQVLDFNKITLEIPGNTRSKTEHKSHGVSNLEQVAGNPEKRNFETETVIGIGKKDKKDIFATATFNPGGKLANIPALIKQEPSREEQLREERYREPTSDNPRHYVHGGSHRSADGDCCASFKKCCADYWTERESHGCATYWRCLTCHAFCGLPIALYLCCTCVVESCHRCELQCHEGAVRLYDPSSYEESCVPCHCQTTT